MKLFNPSNSSSLPVVASSSSKSASPLTVARRWTLLSLALAGGIAGVFSLPLMFAAPSQAQHTQNAQYRSNGTAPIIEDALWHENETRTAPVAIPSLAPLVKRTQNAVLTISTESGGKPVSIDPRDPRGEMLRRFGVPLETPKQMGQGTGFLINADGYALTNHHVVENANSIRVRVGNEAQEYTAEVIGDDPRTDVALIRIKDARRLFDYLPLGNSDQLEVGDFAVAIGNPFGLSQSVSMGIISARSRRDVAPSGRQGLYDFLQTDASINPGNSGGPLLNLNGEVIGINSAVNAAGQGIGFAIPVNLVKQLLPDLRNKGRVERAWLGVGIDRVTPEIAQGLNLPTPYGALIRQVVPGSPADRAGIEPGDIVTRFDGKEVETSTDLPFLAGTAGIGRTVSVEVWRDGKVKTVPVVLGQLPDDDAAGAVGSKESTGAVGRYQDKKLGIELETLSDASRQTLNLSARVQGALIREVDQGSIAVDSGLQRGDVVVKVNGTNIENTAAYAREVDKVKSGSLLRLHLIRDGATMFVAFIKP